jgi:hypothetical protein
MEIALALCLGLGCGALAWRNQFRPLGWLNAWGYLLAIAAIGRGLLLFIPSLAQPLTQGVIAASAIAILGSTILMKVRQPRSGLRNDSGLLVLAAFSLPFLTILHFHPVYDIDSLTYHLPSVVWLQERAWLPDFAREYENHHAHFRMIGFEEFLALSIRGDQLPFFMALIQCLLKALAIFSLASCLPTGFWPGQALLFFFLCREDFFLHSGVNKWIYLNPSFVALFAMVGFFSWRAWRGHRDSFWVALSLLPALAAIKYHGILIVPALSLFLTACSFRRPGLAGFSGLSKLPRSIGLFFLAASALAFEVYGLNWIETGSPLFPWGIGALRAPNTLQTVAAYRLLLPAGNPWQLLLLPWKSALRISPGFSLFGCFALLPLFLCLFLLSLLGSEGMGSGLRTWLKSRFGIVGPSRRSLSGLCFAGVLSWLWVVFTQILSVIDQRFPVFAFGLSSWMLVCACFAFRPRRWAWCYGRTRFSLFVTAVICGLAIYSGSQANGKLRAEELPRKGISLKFLLAGGPPPLSVNDAAYFDRFEQETIENVPALIECRRRLKIGDFDFVSIAPRPIWPSYFIGSLSARADPYAVFAPESLKHYRFALLPREYLRKTPAEFSRLAPWAEKIIELGRQSPPLCGSKDMVFTRI